MPASVYMTPPWRDNPYLDLLMRDLNHCDEVACSLLDRIRILRLVRIALQEPRSVVHLHWLQGAAWGSTNTRILARGLRAIVALSIYRMLGGHFVWTVHNLVSHDMPLTSSEQWLRRRLAHMSQGLIVHSAAAERRIRSMYRLEETITVLATSHPGYSQYYGPLPPRVQARDRWGLEPQERVFLVLGQLRPYKRIDLLLRAFNELLFRYSGPNSPHLIVAGDTGGLASLLADVDDLSDEVQKHITFLDRHVTDDELTALLAAADIFIISQQEYLTSGTLALAMSYGLPIITAAQPDSEELAGHEGDLMYPSFNFEGYVRALLWAADATPEELKQIGRRNRELIEKTTWSDLAADHLALYSMVISG